MVHLFLAFLIFIGFKKTEVKKNAFTVYLGKEGLDKTWQAPFPETIRCNCCAGVWRIAFVAMENSYPVVENVTYVCNLHENKYREGEAWLHDACSVAVYFCKECLNPTAHYNQG